MYLTPRISGGLRSLPRSRYLFILRELLDGEVARALVTDRVGVIDRRFDRFYADRGILGVRTYAVSVALKRLKNMLRLRRRCERKVIREKIIVAVNVGDSEHL